MNDLRYKCLQEEDKFMAGMHLRQSRFKNSAC